MAQMTVYCLFSILIVQSVTHALTCFETNDDGDMIETASEEFTYCVISPERIDGDKFIAGRAFGVGPTIDSTQPYDHVFGVNNKMYTIISFCIYERYNFGKISSRLSFKEPEFMFRCFCNFDKCNREKNFFAYINNLKADSEKTT